MRYKDVEDPTLAECKICGFKKQSIVNHIRTFHKMTIKEYMEVYKTKRVRGRRVYSLIKRKLYRLRNPKPTKERKINRITNLTKEYYTRHGVSQQQAKILVSKVQSFLQHAKQLIQMQDFLKSITFNQMKYLNEQFDNDFIKLKLNGMINKYKQIDSQQKQEQINWSSPGKIKYQQNDWEF